MSLEALVVIGVHVPLAWWLIVVDRFQAAGELADYIEATYLPAWFRWDTAGDPVSWVQHGLIALLVSLWGALWGGLLTPEGALFGAAFAGWCAFGGYCVRECMNAYSNRHLPTVWHHPAPHRVGWAVDGLMDVVGPLVNALLWTLL